MDSIDILPPFSRLLCPMIRTEKLTDRILRGDNSIPIIDEYYHLPEDARDDAENSSTLHHLKLVSWCNNKEGELNDIILCPACWQNTIGTIYYHCDKCKQYYHKECVESPIIFRSPYHPKYPLMLLMRIDRECHSCGKGISNFFYYSSTYDLVLHPVCANKREFPPINNPKRHEHLLHYFPRKASLTCDVCGTDDNKICFYICHQCNFVVHINCVDLPRVIQISRHAHRLFCTYTLSSGICSSCGVCRENIDRNYGEYTCSKGCSYAVHCKCALQKDIWDGRELEDEPENVYDNNKSYEEIGDGIIRHFSHQEHHMRFVEDMYKVYDNENKQYCEACKLPIFDGGNSYRCLECDFSLHEACADLPRTKQIMVHAHQFILKRNNRKRHFFCESCRRYSYGFKYQCSKCNYFDLDVRCASLSEPIHHQSHRHALFLRFYTRRAKEQACSICGELSSQLLNCDYGCVFTLCFACATLPYKFKHENDEHFLTLSYEEDTVFSYVCDLCEKEIDPKKGCYSCIECVTTFHIQCILGNDPYMSPGQLVTFSQEKIDIIPNNHLNRPVCNHCQRHCQNTMIFRRGGNIFCSYLEIIDSILILNS